MVVNPVSSHPVVSGGSCEVVQRHGRHILGGGVAPGQMCDQFEHGRSYDIVILGDIDIEI